MFSATDREKGRTKPTQDFYFDLHKNFMLQSLNIYNTVKHIYLKLSWFYL